MTKEQESFMRKAIELSIESVKNGGGPFGAVIVKDGQIIAEGNNRVTIDSDPTEHAEICAIKNACKKLKNFDLSGCVLYSSCEPCPMCLSAIYWSRISSYYYANNKDDAKDIGFDDAFIYKELNLSADKRSIKSFPMLRNEALIAFNLWRNKTDKKKY